MKKLSLVFAALAVFLSDVMFYVLGYVYRGMLCGIAHAGCSAPAEVAFLYAVPFLIVIAALAALSVVFYRRSKRSR